MNKQFRYLPRTLVAIGATAAAASSRAAGTGVDSILAGVDFSSVGAWVGVTGLVIVGIAMAFKGIDLGKRGVKKA